MKTKGALTNREAQIAELLAWGAAKKQVAAELFVSERTIENHARNIYEKTKVNSVGQLAAWWFCYRYKVPAKDKPALFVPCPGKVRNINQTKRRYENSLCTV